MGCRSLLTAGVPGSYADGVGRYEREYRVRYARLVGGDVPLVSSVVR
jgi:hypothetical protein